MPMLPTLLLGAGLWTAAVAADDRLTVGDPAPALTIEHFVKGERLDGFPTDKVTVVEFWATWCKPCIEGFPHLSELQEQYPDDVVVVGVSAEALDVVEPFLAKPRHAAVTRYRVATDPDGSMQTDWMTAAGKNAIPCAFIVDRDGIVQYIGHPMKMDRVLERVVTGIEAEAPAAPTVSDEERAAFTTLDSRHSPEAAAALETLLADLRAPGHTWSFEQELVLYGALRMGGPDSEPLDLHKTRSGELVLGGRLGTRLDATRTMHLPGMPGEGLTESETVLYNDDTILYRFRSDSPLMPSPLPTDGWTSITRDEARTLADETLMPLPLAVMMEPNPLVASPLDMLEALFGMSALKVVHRPHEEDDGVILEGIAAPMAGIPPLLESPDRENREGAVRPAVRLEYLRGSGVLTVRVGAPKTPSLTMRLERQTTKDKPDASLFKIDAGDGEPQALVPILRERMDSMRAMLPLPSKQG